MTDLKNFQLPDATDKKRMQISEFNPSLIQKTPNIQGRILGFSEKKFGPNSIITRFIFNLSSNNLVDERIDLLNQIKTQNLFSDRLNSTLTTFLIFMLILFWQWGLPMLAEADQLKNDLKEQVQVIEIEKSNQLALERLDKDQKALSENIQKVYAAVPAADEKSEAIISMLEDMATKNRMIIDAIGIRQIPDSQIYYDDLLGFVGIYEYSFTLESELPNILSFIDSVRNSLRLMDIMAMEIEEKEGVYRAGFVLNAYHLSPNDQ